MGAVAMATRSTLRLPDGFQIRELHWLLWAEAERAGPMVGPRPGDQWSFVASAAKDCPSVRAIVSWSPVDDDVADAIGQGVELLSGHWRKKMRAIRARYTAASDVIYMRDLAAELQVTPARISQMADEGQAAVERWVVQTYGS